MSATDTGARTKFVLHTTSIVYEKTKKTIIKGWLCVTGEIKKIWKNYY